MFRHKVEASIHVLEGSEPSTLTRQCVHDLKMSVESSLMEMPQRMCVRDASHTGSGPMMEKGTHDVFGFWALAEFSISLLNRSPVTSEPWDLRAEDPNFLLLQRPCCYGGGSPRLN